MRCAEARIGVNDIVNPRNITFYCILLGELQANFDLKWTTNEYNWKHEKLSALLKFQKDWVPIKLPFSCILLHRAVLNLLGEFSVLLIIILFFFNLRSLHNQVFMVIVEVQDILSGPGAHVSSRQQLGSSPSDIWNDHKSYVERVLRVNSIAVV